MKIYTKIGDKGTTKLVDGSCVDKSDPRVDAYGSVDELNSYLGLVRSRLNAEFAELNSDLERIQNNLFSVGSLLAAGNKSTFDSLPQIEGSHIAWLEQRIDRYSSDLPPLRNFILPGGHPVAAELHIARTVCRRAERMTSVIFKSENHLQEIFIFLNRLSDLLFTLARWYNLKNQIQDVLWKKDNV